MAPPIQMQKVFQRRYLMQAEENLKKIIEQHNITIKALKARIDKVRHEKKNYQAMLRDLRWEKKKARKKVA
jgi:predicted DNA-binding ribbon-helix-helix protein